MRQKRSKAWDMRYHWIRDRDAQGQFIFYWAKGLNNWADYFTKHHATSHHTMTRGMYVKDLLINFQNSLLNVIQQIPFHLGSHTLA